MKKTNAKTYLEKYTKIKSRDGKLIPLKLNPAQIDLIDTMDKNKMVLVRKARRTGITTVIAGYFYYNAITEPKTVSVLIGYNSDLTLEILNKIKNLYNTTPKKSRPAVHYKTKYEIYFPKTKSTILFSPSSEVSSLGEDIVFNNVFASEVAYWDSPEEKIKKLKDLMAKNGRLVIESPSKKLWNGKDKYAKKSYDWKWTYTKEEIAVIKKKMTLISFKKEYGCGFPKIAALD